MKRGKTYAWIPLWIDKWLWGSTRHELAHDERAIFTDLLALAAKDDGWIRANPDTPYPLEQLAGMLCASIELLKRTIDKAHHYGKLEEPIPGIYRITSWDGYQLTDRRKRDLSPISEKTEHTSAKAALLSVSVSSKKGKSEGETSFDAWWSRYPRKVEKKVASKAYLQAVKNGASPDDLAKALEGYRAEIDRLRTEERYIKHASTFLHEDRWRDYLPKPKPTAEEFRRQHEADLKKVRG